jgi:hypothetical protein
MFPLEKFVRVKKINCLKKKLKKSLFAGIGEQKKLPL